MLPWPRPVPSLLATCAVAALAFWRSSPPPPLAADAPPDTFSAGRAQAVLARLLADGAPHPTGSAAHAAFRARLRSELDRLGLPSSEEQGLACSPRGSCAFVTNVVAELPGTTGTRSVLLSAHTDSVAAAPGASDDASGVACILESARALLRSPRRNPVVLLFDDGEEAGLLGAELFMQSARARDVLAVVNLEARGTTGPSTLFETSRQNAWLVSEAVSRLPRPFTSSFFSWVYDRLPNDTNLTVFKRDGLPGLNLAFVGSASRYHTPLDRLSTLSPATLQHQGENALALTRALAQAEPPSRAPGRSVFFDVLGLGVLRWPREASPFLAVAALLLVRLVVVRRGGRPVPGPLALVPPLSPLAAAAAGALVWLLLKELRAFPVTFVAWPWAAAAAAALAGLAVSVPLLWRAARRSGSAERLWERTWTSLALVGLVLALAAPEVCYAPVAATLVAGAAGLATRGPLAAWLPGLALAALLLPIALRLPEALGAPSLPAVAFVAALSLAALAPCEAAAATTAATAPAAPLPRRLSLALGLGSVAASLAALALPKTTPDSPESGSFLVVQDAEKGTARLVHTPESARLRRGLAAAARFGPREPAVPWGRRADTFAAPIAPVDAPGPELTVVSEEALHAGRRRLVLRLVSPRGAPSLALVVPDGSAIDGIRVEGAPLAQPYLRRPARGPAQLSLSCQGAPPEGIRVQLDLPVGRREAYVVDQSPGLPPLARAAVAARPADLVPGGPGDRTLLHRRSRL